MRKLLALKVSRLILIACFLVMAFGFIIYQRNHKLRVFILQSYHPTMSWTQGLRDGVAQVFKKRHYIDVRSFYMNTKNKHSKEYLRRIGRDAIAAIKHYKPNVLIVFDINAQKLIAKTFVNDPAYTIVFAGVTDTKDLIKFKSSKNITGVLEKIPVKAIQEVLSLMFKKGRNIYYLSDDSITARQLDKDVPNENWGEFNFVAHHRAKTFKNWQKYVLEAQSKADMILMSTYQTIIYKKKHISPIKLVDWTLKHSKIPVIGLDESFISNGGYLSISVASYEQGYTAAKIAMFILEKKIQIDKIPFIKSQMFQLQMRKQKVLKNYPGVVIPLILEAFSKTKWQLDDVIMKELPRS